MRRWRTIAGRWLLCVGGWGSEGCLSGGIGDSYGGDAVFQSILPLFWGLFHIDSLSEVLPGNAASVAGPSVGEAPIPTERCKHVRPEHQDPPFRDHCVP